MTKKLIASVFAPLFALALLAAGCGDDGGGGGDREAIVEFLVGEGETQESAECFADELSDYDLSEFEAVNAGGDVDEDFVSDITAASEACADAAGE